MTPLGSSWLAVTALALIIKLDLRQQRRATGRHGSGTELAISTSWQLESCRSFLHPTVDSFDNLDG
jgi:hypothetical protein